MYCSTEPDSVRQYFFQVESEVALLRLSAIKEHDVHEFDVFFVTSHSLPQITKAVATVAYAGARHGVDFSCAFPLITLSYAHTINERWSVGGEYGMMLPQVVGNGFFINYTFSLCPSICLLFIQRCKEISNVWTRDNDASLELRFVSMTSNPPVCICIVVCMFVVSMSVSYRRTV